MRDSVRNTTHFISPNRKRTIKEKFLVDVDIMTCVSTKGERYQTDVGIHCIFLKIPKMYTLKLQIKKKIYEIFNIRLILVAGWQK